MSYILESIKKSDKERRSIDRPTAMVLSAPAFLENDKPKANYRWLIIFIVAVLLAVICFSIVYFNKSSFSDYLSDTTQRVSSISAANVELTKEKEEAILLYKQALSTKSQPEIDSLYKELNQKRAALTPRESAVSQAIRVSDNTTLDNNELVSESSSDFTPVLAASLVSEEAKSIEAVASPVSTSMPTPKEQNIPSIYELDAYFRKDIPSVNYGAHIYATDNNSGFVILDGARRRVGDQLDSGLFIEKIEEESVVLSFNGTLFSLPAMKSWEGK